MNNKNSAGKTRFKLVTSTSPESLENLLNNWAKMSGVRVKRTQLAACNSVWGVLVSYEDEELEEP